MVSVLPTSATANGIFSWFVYGMLAVAAFAATNQLIGRELEAAVSKKE